MISIDGGTGVITSNNKITLPAGSGAPGSVIQVVNTNATAVMSDLSLASNGVFYGITDLDTTITSLAANSKFIVSCQIFGEGNLTDHVIAFAWQRGISGTFTDFMKGDDDGASRREVTAMMNGSHYSSDQASSPSTTTLVPLVDSPSQAAGTAITYRIGISKQSGSAGTFRGNKSYTDSNTTAYERGASWMTVMEIAV